MKYFLLALLLLASCGKDDGGGSAPIVPPAAKVKIGTPAIPNTTYSWLPVDSLDNPKAAEPIASPKKTTTYTVTATNACGSADSHVTVRVYTTNPQGELVEVH